MKTENGNTIIAHKNLSQDELISAYKQSLGEILNFTKPRVGMSFFLFFGYNTYKYSIGKC